MSDRDENPYSAPRTEPSAPPRRRSLAQRIVFGALVTLGVLVALGIALFTICTIALMGLNPGLGGFLLCGCGVGFGSVSCFALGSVWGVLSCGVDNLFQGGGLCGVLPVGVC